MKRIAIALLAGLIASPALAANGDMSVAAFLAKADGLKAMGFRALGSPDIRLLRDEGQAAGMAYRDRLQAEKAQGKPSSCPPKGVKVGANEVMTHLRGYPAPAKAGTTMRTAMADYFIRKYPCKQ